MSGKDPELVATVSFKNVGRWIHDEERGREQEAEGDMDWREDDDNMILAPGELKGFRVDYLKWAIHKSWFPCVKFEENAGEKNWFTITITVL